jgi:putative ABC transport system permease protein
MRAFFETFAQDLRYTLRGLRAKPGFTTAVVLTLALGIGANAAMFGIVDRMLFRPPPMLRDPDMVHRIYDATTFRGQERINNVSRYAKFLDFTGYTTSFSSTAAYTPRQLAFGVGDAAREMQVGVVSASFFGFFDAPPVLGRYFTTAEDSVPEGQAVVVLSYGYWSTAFGQRRDVLGQRIQIGPTPFTIIGIAPEGFVGVWPDQPPAAFIPITNYGATQARGFSFLKNGVSWWRTYSWGWMSMMARRKPGISVEQATADLTRAAQRSYQNQLIEQPKSTPIALAKPSAMAASILTERGPNQSSIAKVARWVGGVSLIVLLIACANVANLLLARALRRRREVAVRIALGVSRRRLLSQLLTESVVLAVFGGVAGLFIARFGSVAMRAALFTKSVDAPVLSDARTLLFAAGAALFVGVITGLAPMYQTIDASRSLVADLKAGSREGAHRSRVRIVLLVLQAALCVVLLVGAGLFVRSLNKVHNARLGYDIDPVMLVDLNMRGIKLDSAPSEQLRQKLLATAGATPGVTHAALSVAVPFWSSWSTLLFVQGVDTVGRLGQFNLNAVSPDYFAVMGTRILRGRGFTSEDQVTSPRVAVVSEGMAKTLWRGRDALGQCMRVNADTMPCTTIVGISEDIRQRNIAGDSALYSYYLPSTQANQTGGLTLRVRGKATQYADAVRRALQRDMPGTSYITVTPFAEVVGSTTKSWEMGATMFLVFGGLALALAAIGLYSVIAYNVAQRTHEVGVRVALGAQSGDVIRLIVGEGVRLGSVGLVLGAVTAFGAARWLKPLLFDESPRDPVVFAAVTLMLLVVTIVASWVPARRAARVDPQVALRTD